MLEDPTLPMVLALRSFSSEVVDPFRLEIHLSEHDR